MNDILKGLTNRSLLTLYAEFEQSYNYDPVNSTTDRLHRDWPGITGGMVRLEILRRMGEQT